MPLIAKSSAARIARDLAQNRLRNSVAALTTRGNTKIINTPAVQLQQHAQQLTTHMTPPPAGAWHSPSSWRYSGVGASCRARSASDASTCAADSLEVTARPCAVVSAEL